MQTQTLALHTVAATSDAATGGAGGSMVRFEQRVHLSEKIQRGLRGGRNGPGAPCSINVNDRFIGIGTDRGVVLVFDFYEELRQVLRRPATSGGDTDGAVTSLDIQNYLVAGYYSGKIILWDFMNGLALKVVELHSSPIVCVKFCAPNLPLVLSSDFKGVVNMTTFSKFLIKWNADSKTLLNGRGNSRIVSVATLFPTDIQPTARTKTAAAHAPPEAAFNAMRRAGTIIALGSCDCTYIVTTSPTIRIAHKWMPAYDVPVDALQCLAFGFARVYGSAARALRGGGRSDAAVTNHPGDTAMGLGIATDFATPVLARGWGKHLEILQVQPPTGYGVEYSFAARTAGVVRRSADGGGGASASTAAPLLDMVVAEDLASTQYIHGLGWLSDELLGYITTGRDASSDRSLEYLNVLHTAELRDMEATDITHANVVHAAVQSGEVVKSRDAAAGGSEVEVVYAPSYQNSLVTVNGEWFVLGRDQLNKAEALSWTDRLEVLMQKDLWLDTLALAADHYEATKTATVSMVKFRMRRAREACILARKEFDGRSFEALLREPVSTDVTKPVQRVLEQFVDIIFSHSDLVPTFGRKIVGRNPAIDPASGVETTKLPSSAAEVSAENVRQSIAATLQAQQDALAADAKAAAQSGSRKKRGSVEADTVASASTSTASDDTFRLFAVLLVDYCVTVDRPDLLFGLVYSKALAVGRENTLLEVLEPFILSGKLTQLSPELMKALVMHYEEAGKLADVERCLLRLNVQDMDLNVAVIVCVKHQLYTALTSVYTRGLQDTCTPVDLLLALHASAWLNDDGMPSFSPEQRRAQEQLANEIGMMDSRDTRQRQWIPPLLMAYLEQTLKAKQFPFGDSLDESIAGDTVARIASFLFDESPADFPSFPPHLTSQYLERDETRVSGSRDNIGEARARQLTTGSSALKMLPGKFPRLQALCMLNMRAVVEVLAEYMHYYEQHIRQQQAMRAAPVQQLGGPTPLAMLEAVGEAVMHHVEAEQGRLGGTSTTASKRFQHRRGTMSVSTASRTSTGTGGAASRGEGGYEGSGFINAAQQSENMANVVLYSRDEAAYFFMFAAKRIAETDWTHRPSDSLLYRVMWFLAHRVDPELEERYTEYQARHKTETHQGTFIQRRHVHPFEIYSSDLRESLLVALVSKYTLPRSEEDVLLSQLEEAGMYRPAVVLYKMRDNIVKVVSSYVNHRDLEFRKSVFHYIEQQIERFNPPPADGRGATPAQRALAAARSPSPTYSTSDSDSDSVSSGYDSEGEYRPHRSGHHTSAKKKAAAKQVKQEEEVRPREDGMDRPGTLEDLKSVVRLNLISLITLAEDRAEMLTNLLDADATMIVEDLQDHTELQLQYLKRMMDPSQRKTQSLSTASLNELHKHYVRLLCKHEKDSVYSYLTTPFDYPLNETLEILEQFYDRQDAKAYLMERRGNVEKAFKLLLEDLRTGITALTRAAQHVYDQGGLVNMSDVVEQLAKQPGNLYLPATVTSAAAAVAASSGNPLEMTPVLGQGKGQGGETAEASAPKPVKKSAELEAENNRVPCFPEFQQMYHALMLVVQLCQRHSRSAQSQSENLWFELLGTVIQTKEAVHHPDLGHSQRMFAGRGAATAEAALQEAMAQLIRIILEAMRTYVALDVVLKRILSEHGTAEFREFRDTILSMLETCTYEKRLLITSTRLMRGDIYRCLEDLLRQSVHGVRPTVRQCKMCNMPLDQPPGGLNAADRRSRAPYEVIAFAQGPAFHLRCYEAESNTVIGGGKPAGGLRPSSTRDLVSDRRRSSAAELAADAEAAATGAGPDGLEGNFDIAESLGDEHYDRLMRRRQRLRRQQRPLALVQQEMSQTGPDQAPAGGFGLFAATTVMGGDATQLLLEPANEPQGPLAPSLDPRLDEETPIRIR